MKQFFTIIIAIVAMNMSFFCIAQSAPLRHVVSFKFKSEASAEQIQALIESFSELKKKIPQIQMFEMGTNNSPEGLSKGFTHCFILTFKNEKDRDTYLPHPDHQLFIKEHGSIVDDVFVIDFYAVE